MRNDMRYLHLVISMEDIDLGADMNERKQPSKSLKGIGKLKVKSLRLVYFGPYIWRWCQPWIWYPEISVDAIVLFKSEMLISMHGVR